MPMTNTGVPKIREVLSDIARLSDPSSLVVLALVSIDQDDDAAALAEKDSLSWPYPRRRT